MKFFATALVAAAIGAAHANAQQPAPDPAFMQKAIVALQAQRNSALDAQAAAEARAAVLTEENAALKKQVEGQKAEPKKD